MAIALVTGSSTGFGKLIVQSLLSKGHTVIATMRDPKGRNADNAEEIQKYAVDTEGHAHVLDMDVSSDSSVEAAVKEALEIHPHIDVLVNNAGLGTGGISEGFTSDQFNKLMDVNVTGVHRVTRAVLPCMRAAGSGLIINISSVMGRIIIPFASIYSASKYALEGYTESLRYELKATGTGVEVVSLEPGGFATNFLENMQQPLDTERVAEYGEAAHIPDQMWAGMGEQLQGEGAPDPQEVADAVISLTETPAGERPLRIVVDPMFGGEAPTAINNTTNQIQKELMENFGMGNAL